MKNIFMTFLYFLLSLVFAFFIFYGLNSPCVLMVMLLPVFVVSNLYGARYGYVTTFASAAAIYFFFCEPLDSFVLKDSSSFVRIVTYLVSAVISIVYISKKNTAENALKQAEKVVVRTHIELKAKRETERLLEAARDSEEEIQALNEELEASLKSIEVERNYLQEIMDEMPSVIIIKNEKLRYIFVNNALCDFLGKPKWELLDKTVFDLLPQEVAEHIWANENAILQSNTTQTLEEAVTDGTGAIRTLLSVKKPLMTDNGEMGLLVMLTDITELKSMEAALQESELSYRSLFDNMLNGFAYCRMLFDDNGRASDFVYLAVNEAFESLTGLVDVVGRKVSEVIPDVQKTDRDLIELYGRVSDTGVGEHLEMYVSALKDWYSISVYCPKPGYFVAVFDVITKRKMADTVMQESEEKFRVIFESSRDALMLSDEHGFVDCNISTLELFGIEDKNELIRCHPADLSPAFQPDGKDSLTAAKEQIGIAMEKGSNYFEWEHMRKNGEVFSADVLLTAFDYHGKRIIQATVRDITERRNARRTSALLRKFFDNTNEGMTITDADGIISAVNPAFSEITGYTSQEVIGVNPRILQSGEHSKKFYEQMWHDIIENGRWEGEILNKRKNGQIYPEWLIITPIHDDNGQIENFVAVFFDLTILKEKQEQIDEQDRIILAQSRFAAMGEMISMIAHQWRQPITAIGMGANNMLVDIELGDIDTEAFRSHLESINGQVQFLSHTIDDFRDFFKPNREMSGVNMSTIVDSSLKIVSKSLENNNIAIRKEMDYDPVIMAYENELMQVLLAIINNAKDVLLEHAVKPAFVSISTQTNPEFPGFVELHICDNGGGVPEDIRQKIFEPYFTTKSAKNGTGLGLYIAKSIVQKHQNGTIFVENRDDQACFIIRLPTTVIDLSSKT